MNQISTPGFKVLTDDGTIPENDTIGDATYTTSGIIVTIDEGTTPLATILAIAEGSMLYSSGKNDVKMIHAVSIREPIMYLNEAFDSDVSTPESLKVVQRFPVKSLGIVFKNASGIVNGKTIPQNTPISPAFNAKSITAIAYNNTTNSSTMVVSDDR